jgi:predicted permease
MKHALRILAKSPAFSAVIIAMVALAIGANTAIFSVLQAVVLRPLPLREPARLVRVYETQAEGADASRYSMSPRAWKLWSENNTVFDGLARAEFASRTYSAGGQEAQRLVTSQVSANFFSVLGVQPVLGRDFVAEDDKPGAAPVVIVGDTFWRNTLGARPDAIGSTIALDGQAHTVIGVMAAGFRHPFRSDIWVPFATAIDLAQVGGNSHYAPARLKPGVTPAAAERAMRDLIARLNREMPAPSASTGAAILPLHSLFVADLRPRLVAVTAAALFVLLIAGANLASLFLARHLEREGDSSVRLALGASRARLIRESLAQSLVLTGTGALLGVLLAAWLLPLLVALSPLGGDSGGGAIREFHVPIALNLSVLACSVGATFLLAFGFGLLPALRSARAELGTALRSVGRGGSLDASSRRWLRFIVAAEVAVAALLLVGTGVMLRSFANLVGEQWGYATAHRLVADVSFTSRLRPEHPQRVDYVERALGKLRALPGVKSAYATTPHQMFPAFSLAAVTPEGATPPEPQGFYITYHRMVFPGYFRDAGIPILAGRPIDETDRPDGQRVVVVSETFAKRMWPGRATDPRPPFLVVGVAADRKAIIDRDDGDVVGQWYLPYVQNPRFLADTVTFVLETQPAPESLQAAVRAALNTVDPNIAASNFNTLERLVDTSYANDRFALLLIGLFGALGLLLSAIGLYGLLALHVARRTREIGVRTALGATGGDIVWLVFREGGLLVAAGLLLGLIGARFAIQPFAGELNRVSPGDPLVYLGAVAVVIVVALAAMFLPARRAARVDPLIALRSE